jgi:uncharacterized protein YjgD (DUF1641 family)
MAQAIPATPHTRDLRAELHARIQNAPDEHAEAVLAAYEVLQGLHDRGVLELLRGALGSSDKVLEIAVDAARGPQSIRSLRNLLIVVNLLGEIDPALLGSLTSSVSQTLKTTAEPSAPPGLWGLLTSVLFNRDIRRALGKSVALLESVGRSLAPDARERPQR